MDPLTQLLMQRSIASSPALSMPAQPTNQQPPQSALSLPSQPALGQSQQALQLPAQSALSIPPSPAMPFAQPNTPVIPPNPAVRVPPEAKRFERAQQLMEAYRNRWNPNPILLQAQLGNK